MNEKLERLGQENAALKKKSSAELVGGVEGSALVSV